MSNLEMCVALLKARENQNIALSMLLLYAAQRIWHLHGLVNTNSSDVMPEELK